MNIAHLKYAVEVEKTASITKAAENLFMGQPNLSRGIKELEETLGVKIFKRTSKGIVPTPQGEEFLGYAKSILAQIEEMESLYKPEKNNKLKFSISVPRASYIADAFSKFVREADMSKEIEFNFKETNAMRAIRNVVQENYGLAIVRYQTIFESFFTNMLRDKGMKSENIWEFEYQLIHCQNAFAAVIFLTYLFIDIERGHNVHAAVFKAAIRQKRLAELARADDDGVINIIVA